MFLGRHGPAYLRVFPTKSRFLFFRLNLGSSMRFCQDYYCRLDQHAKEIEDIKSRILARVGFGQPVGHDGPPYPSVRVRSETWQGSDQGYMGTQGWNNGTVMTNIKATKVLISAQLSVMYTWCMHYILIISYYIHYTYVYLTDACIQL